MVSQYSDLHTLHPTQTAVAKQPPKRPAAPIPVPTLPPRARQSLVMRALRAILAFLRLLASAAVAVVRDARWFVLVALPWLLGQLVRLPWQLAWVGYALRQVWVSCGAALWALAALAHRIPMAPEGLHLVLAGGSLVAQVFSGNVLGIFATVLSLPRRYFLALWFARQAGERLRMPGSHRCHHSAHRNNIATDPTCSGTPAGMRALEAVRWAMCTVMGWLHLSCPASAECFKVFK